jgi:hypothetical protein
MIKVGSTVFEFRKITSGGASSDGKEPSEKPEYREDEDRPRRHGETEI